MIRPNRYFPAQLNNRASVPHSTSEISIKGYADGQINNPQMAS